MGGVANLQVRGGNREEVVVEMEEVEVETRNMSFPDSLPQSEVTNS